MRKTILIGRDAEALDILIGLHRPSPRLICDITHNNGVMWRGSDYRPDYRVDLLPFDEVNVRADNTALPFKAGAFDVIVYDPPHLPVAAASAGGSNMWRERYGITDSSHRAAGDNVSAEFGPVLNEAKRVLAADGVILCKIIDLVHNHRHQWQHIDLILAAQAIGLTACDMLIKADPAAGNLKSSKWKNQYHLRNAHCFWIVLRAGKRCERRE